MADRIGSEYGVLNYFLVDNKWLMVYKIVAVNGVVHYLVQVLVAGLNVELLESDRQIHIQHKAYGPVHFLFGCILKDHHAENAERDLFAVEAMIFVISVHFGKPCVDAVCRGTAGIFKAQTRKKRDRIGE